MLLQVLEMVLPVLVLLLIGCWCRYKQIFDLRGLAGLKAVIGEVTLPVVLFNAFFTARYSITVLLLFVTVYLGFGLAMAAGFGLRRLAAPYGKFLPFLLTGAEGGMLGYALYGLLTGEQSGFAMVDMGQTVFAYTAFMGMLKLVDGQAVSPKQMVRNMVTNRCFVGMSLGILLGATGMSGPILAHPAGKIVSALLPAFTAPTSALVLLVVGYELNLKKELLKPVAITVLLRLALMGVLLAAMSLLIFHIVPFDRSLQIALMVMYALPAPFIIPLFADVGEDGEYLSTTLSLHTLCTMLLFAAIAAYAVAG